MNRIAIQRRISISLAGVFLALSSTMSVAQAVRIATGTGPGAIASHDGLTLPCIGCRSQAVGGGMVIELRNPRTQQQSASAGTGNGVSLAPREHPLYAAMDHAARIGEVDAAMVKAVAWTESRFRRESVSPKGARGLMQLMPETADRLGVTDSFDTAQSLSGGARLLGQLLRRYQGDLSLTLAAYNAGEGAVARFGMQVPPFAETRNYIAQVKASMAWLAGAAPRQANAERGGAEASAAAAATPRRPEPQAVLVPAGLSGALVRIAAPGTTPAHEAADAYMAARDRGDYAAMAELLSRSGQGGWTAERAERIDAGRLRVSGLVVSRRYVAEKPGANAATTVIYDTQFSKSGRSEERVLVLRSGDRQAVAGHTARHCNTGACFKDD